ncbi:MAG: DUF3800 domain-containing protein [Chloroflexi bacterium]|nr:DUF3800 domain-containing protein [Chloroflexota bacterium]
MTDIIRYAFIDESGTVGITTGTHFVIVAVICANQARDIEIPVQRAQKKFGTSLASGEMKANNSREAVVLRLLGDLIKEDIQIVAVAIDQRNIIRPPLDEEEIYRKVVSRAVHHLVKRWPRIQICLDQRYTNGRLRFALERRIREELVGLPQKVVLIRQLNSQAERGLQAADFIAWAFFQKYERGDNRFVDVLAPKIMLDELLKKRTWAKGKPK